jgi:sarcosine oxidase subunit alpha
VPCIVDARPEANGPLPEEARAMGIPVKTGTAIAGVKGIRGVVAVQLCNQAGEGAVTEEVVCEAVAMSGGWSPAVHLWSHCGGKLTWDEAGAFFRPDPARPPTNQTGDGLRRLRGVPRTARCMPPKSWRTRQPSARKALEKLGKTGNGKLCPQADAPDEAPLAPVWIMPQGAGTKKRAKMWLDFQNDVKVSDVQLAAREGYESVEHTKRYTTLGMATDQGKLSNINGLAVLADALNARSRRSAPPPSARPSAPSPWAPSRARRGARCSSRSAARRSTPPRRGRRGVGAGGPLAAALLLPETG